MGRLRADNIQNSTGTSGPIFVGPSEFSTTAHIVLPKGTTAQRPVGVSTGALRFNTETLNVEYYNGTDWIEVTWTDPSNRGVFGGGYSVPTTYNIIDYITIASTGNATDFGDLTVVRYRLAACSSSTRGVFGGGATPSISNVIDYITITTTGNAIDFGDLTVIRSNISGCSSSTRGIFGGGFNQLPGFGQDVNIIDYITIASIGNALDFGDLTQSRFGLGACSSSTRGVFGGGFSYPGVYHNIIDYITIASTGNATDFGDLTVARYSLAACSNNTRAVFGGDALVTNTIDYITIASTGNATDFGDLTVARNGLAACSSSTRGVFGGGATPGTNTNTIDYITIATTGNATDFGDLTVSRQEVAACSNTHGGLS